MASEKRVVLITGAGSGIGMASALEYAKNDFIVVATMRNVEKSVTLIDAAKASGVQDNIVVRQLDVTKAETVVNCVEETLREQHKIDVLLCSAAAEIPASLDELDIEVGKQLMDVNYWGVIRVFQEVFKHMKERKSGHVQVVSSWAGRFSNFPFFASYNPTKHALEAAFEGFYGLAKLDGVSISMIEPGPVQTDIHGQFVQDGNTYIKTEQRKQNFESVLYGFFASGVTKITQSKESVAKLIVENAKKNNPEFRVPTSEAVNFNIGLFDSDTTGAARVAGAEMLPALVVPEEVKTSEAWINFKKGQWRTDFSTFDQESQEWIEAKKAEIKAKNPDQQ